MTDRYDVSTAEEFNDALAELLVAGVDAGVDVGGGWTCRNGDDHDDWEVVVTLLSDPGGGA
jgi:hypothetical protein